MVRRNDNQKQLLVIISSLYKVKYNKNDKLAYNLVETRRLFIKFARYPQEGCSSRISTPFFEVRNKKISYKHS